MPTRRSGHRRPSPGARRPRRVPGTCARGAPRTSCDSRSLASAARRDEQSRRVAIEPVHDPGCSGSPPASFLPARRRAYRGRGLRPDGRRARPACRLRARARPRRRAALRELGLTALAHARRVTASPPRAGGSSAARRRQRAPPLRPRAPRPRERAPRRETCRGACLPLTRGRSTEPRRRARRGGRGSPVRYDQRDSRITTPMTMKLSAIEDPNVHQLIKPMKSVTPAASGREEVRSCCR